MIEYGRMGMVKGFEVYPVDLNPARCRALFKTRPVLVVNKYLKNVIIAPKTTKERKIPTRGEYHFYGKDGLIALDQIRRVDKSRLINKMGEIECAFHQQALEVLQTMFEEK